MKISKEKHTIFVQRHMKMETKYTETLQDSAKTVLRETFMLIKSYRKKQKYLK